MEQSVSILQEIASRDQTTALAALATAEARLRLVMKAANIGFWDWDIKMNTVLLSAEWKRQLGLNDVEISNDFNDWMDHLHPEDQDQVRAVVEGFYKNPRSDYDMEFRLRHGDGAYRWIRSQGVLIRDENGQPARMLGVHVDITPHKRAAEERALLAAIVECSNDAIIGESLDGTITSWNKSAERIYGYAECETLGHSVRMLVPRDLHLELTEILKKLRAGHIVEHLETRRLRKDGRQIQVSLVISPIRDTHGKIIGASAIARDITERKQLEMEVLQISEREQQRIAQDLHDGLGQLLSGTAHLSAVLQLDLAEQALPEAGEAMRITDLLHQSVAEARSLARGLYPVSSEPNGLLVALEELANRTRTVFRCDCRFHARDQVLIEDDFLATHLYRIAQEAITNAMRHGHAQRIQIVLRATVNRIILWVQDDGMGGLPKLPCPKGIGIRIMQYRAGIIGGTLILRKTAPKGVRVICTVPKPAKSLWNRITKSQTKS